MNGKDYRSNNMFSSIQGKGLPVILCSLCIVITMIMFGCDEEVEDPNYVWVVRKRGREREGVISWPWSC